ncbi:MAG: DMT family transporter [Thermonemataceae bacterium]|nr:DMT family transporter [Thermonemataceae bacterium]
MHPLVLVFYRTLITALAFGLWFYIIKKPLRIPRMDLLKILGTGGIIAIHWLLFFGASRVATISVCLVGLATTTLWTSLLEPLFYRRKFRSIQVILGLVTFAGIFEVFRAEFNYAEGFILGILSALAGALFSVLNSQFVRKHDQFTITFYEMIGAFVSVAVFLLFYGFSSEETLQILPQGLEWLWIAILALVCTVYAYPVGVKLMKKFSVFAVNLTVNLEPVYGIMLAFVIFGESEKMSANFYIGAIIILLAVFFYPIFLHFSFLRKKKIEKKKRIMTIELNNHNIDASPLSLSTNHLADEQRSI